MWSFVNSDGELEYAEADPYLEPSEDYDVLLDDIGGIKVFIITSASSVDYGALISGPKMTTSIGGLSMYIAGFRAERGGCNSGLKRMTSIGGISRRITMPVLSAECGALLTGLK